MKSSVYLMDLRSRYTDNLLQKLNRLLENAGIEACIKVRDLVAVKLHFGERGNTAFIRPIYIRQIVHRIKDCGGTPFLTDTNTLYAGTRGSSPEHIETALKNGFSYTAVAAPIVIADGLRGRSDTAVQIGCHRFDQVFIGSDILHADALVSVAHFKGHELTGFAGTLKNIGMGCASRRGKLAQHCSVSPKIKKKRCIACGACVAHCPVEAISLDPGKKAAIAPETCIGCGECIVICPEGAINIRWDQDVPLFMEKMVEYTVGTLRGKKGKALFLNFLTDISPGCDCTPYNDAPIVRNIGILASADPVAVDQAAADLVNAETALAGTAIKKNLRAGEDKFRGLYPDVDWEYQLDYAERLNLGRRQYELIRIA